jgi:hypothetical protein
MISSSLAQRLKRLEARAMPAVGQSMVIEVRFVCPVKGVTGSLLIEIGPRTRIQESPGQTRRRDRKPIIVLNQSLIRALFSK